MRIKILPILFLSIISSGKLPGQSHFTLYAGTAVPVGNFSSDDSDRDYSGGANVGFNIGGKYLYNFTQTNVNLFLSADFNYNGLKESVKDDIKSNLEDVGLYVEIDYYKFINVPLLTGLNLNIPADENLSLWLESGIGLDILKITNMTIYTNNEKATAQFNSSTQFAFTVGGGLKIKDKYLIGVHYNGLGKHRPKGKINSNGQSIRVNDYKIEVSTLSINIGILF
ncbi:MAG TPA: outer membrane beta-barrel protein [Bacteroidales bacterium]|nr:outer membrane beta-barrel protein [Bacteroidales bacterium]HOK99003.1 outer membrane beta-barrel protein [Bacteroidales bacterium]HPO65447.1 outer membrane beta-barrel protein [Bacteroidales bacterium]